ncbi:DUF1576 domain-containing protein [Alloiococcus sp. CFN-8]|uniref:DUF1576 domain-containing protein n=1 Tax=Alloiococcus sp. CFN-8 TaxID=3416081 RepID=UPI003CF86153
MKENIAAPYKFHIFIFIGYMVLGLLLDSPKEIYIGLNKIIEDSAILITDYVAIAGVAPTLVNAGLLSLMITLFYTILDIKPNGAILTSLWLVFGFSFFGKNIFNVWSIIFGVYLFSRYKKEPFNNYILIAVLGTTLAPTVSQIVFRGILPPVLSLVVGNGFGIIIGFILPPIAVSTVGVHYGYNLYNMGFAGGLLGMILMSVYKIFNVDIETRFFWSTGNNVFFALLLYTTFIIIIIYGYYNNGKNFRSLKKIISHSGRLNSDYYSLYLEASFINVGFLGILGVSSVLILGGDLNGPTISGIFTLAGFGTFGKHIKNVIPVMIGAALTSHLCIWELKSPSMILSILFSTGLAPIAGEFSWLFGILAGFIHGAVVMNIGSVNCGMNLYNNGFSAGFVAMVLVPIIRSLNTKRENN